LANESIGMMPGAIVPGAVVWLVLGVGVVAWLIAAVMSRGALIGPRRIIRWLLSCWTSRIVMLAAWGIAGWHIFCQRP
jgi:hypothetical protein